MSGSRATLFALILVFAGLLIFPPQAMQRVGYFLTFGLSRAESVPSADIEKKISESRIAASVSPSQKFLVGDVYSLYPMNFKDQLVVDMGSGSGVKKGGAAIWNGILIGRVKEVRGTRVVIQTVFDPNFSIPVRVGRSKVDALLQGGVEPKITLIPKNSSIDPEEAVYSASQDFEYGLPLGVLGAVTATPSSVFSEAGLVLGYSPLDLRYVYIEKE